MGAAELLCRNCVEFLIRFKCSNFSWKCALVIQFTGVECRQTHTMGGFLFLSLSHSLICRHQCVCALTKHLALEKCRLSVSCEWEKFPNSVNEVRIPIYGGNVPISLVVHPLTCSILLLHSSAPANTPPFPTNNSHFDWHSWIKSLFTQILKSG